MPRLVRTHLSIKRCRDGTGHVMVETHLPNTEHDSGLMCFMSFGPEDSAPQVREVRTDTRGTGQAKVEWARADGRKVSIIFGQQTSARTLGLDLLMESDLPSDDEERSRPNPGGLEQMAPERS